MARTDTNFQIRAFVRAAIGLSIELPREYHVRLDGKRTEETAVVNGDFERQLLHGSEQTVRTRVRGVSDANRRALAKSQRRAGIEIRLVPQLPARAVAARASGVQAVPRPDVHPDALESAVS